MIKNLLLVFFFMFITTLAFAFNNGSNCAECRNEKTVKGKMIDSTIEALHKTIDHLKGNEKICRKPRPNPDRNSKKFIPFMELHKVYSNNLCAAVRVQNLKSFRGQIEDKLKEIYQKTNICYSFQDEEIFGSIRCPDSSNRKRLNIFQYAAYERKQEMMEELYNNFGFDINHENKKGINIHDFISLRIYQLRKKMKKYTDSRNQDILKSQIEYYKKFQEGISRTLGAREGSFMAKNKEKLWKNI